MGRRFVGLLLLVAGVLACAGSPSLGQNPPQDKKVPVAPPVPPPVAPPGVPPGPVPPVTPAPKSPLPPIAVLAFEAGEIKSKVAEVAKVTKQLRHKSSTDRWAEFEKDAHAKIEKALRATSDPKADLSTHIAELKGVRKELEVWIVLTEELGMRVSPLGVLGMLGSPESLADGVREEMNKGLPHDQQIRPGEGLIPYRARMEAERLKREKEKK